MLSIKGCLSSKLVSYTALVVGDLAILESIQSHVKFTCLLGLLLAGQRSGLKVRRPYSPAKLGWILADSNSCLLWTKLLFGVDTDMENHTVQRGNILNTLQ